MTNPAKATLKKDLANGEEIEPLVKIDNWRILVRHSLSNTSTLGKSSSRTGHVSLPYRRIDLRMGWKTLPLVFNEISGRDHTRGWRRAKPTRARLLS